MGDCGGIVIPSHPYRSTDDGVPTPRIPTLRRYWNDPEFRAAMDAETQVMQAKWSEELNAPIRAKQEAIWAAEEGESA